MTALGSGMPGREMMTDETPRRGIGRQIGAIMLIGLVFRLMMAYAHEPLRGSGFGNDLDLFRYWADTLATYGPPGFYENASFADYTPGYLYALWVVGVVGNLIGGIGDLIKLPAILTDIALGYIVYSMVRELGVTERRATIAGAVVILNPITWFDSVVWGQVDSFGTVFLLLAVRELWRGRSERSAILAVVAALIKPQLAILVPIVAVVTIRRALWPVGGWGDEDPPRPGGLAWERRTLGPVRILTTGLAGLVTAIAMAAPFGLSVVSITATAPYLESSLLRLVFSTAAQYSYVSVNAYNLWALFPLDGASMATSGGWIRDAPVPDATAWAALGPVPAAVVGAVLLLGVAAITSLVVAKRPDRLTILVGVCVLALAFFAVPTRVHERYLFPFFGLAAILFAFSWRWRIAYVVAGLATFLNMYVVLTTIYPDNPSVSDWLGIGPAIRSFSGVAIVAVMHAGAFAWGVMQLRSRARGTLALELADGRLERARPAPDEPEAQAPGTEPPEPHSPAPTTTVAAAVQASPAGSGAPPPTADPSPTVVRRVPAWYDRPGWGELGPIGWIRARMRETPVRPDRSGELAREGGGRLGRLDIWILVVLVVASFGMRTFRLDEPARMHFDEVYHARTATEFLQAWRYGISHNIYEWTHPHLAKYAMAGGIVTFAGHDASAASDLGVPVRDAAIEPRREDPLGEADRAGDRVWIATGSELVAFDLATRKLVARWSVPGASAVAFDETGYQVYAGTDGGELLAVDATALDAPGSYDPSQPPATVDPVATADGPIRRLVSFSDGQHLAAMLPGDTVTVFDGGTGAVTGSLVVAGVADVTPMGDGDAVVATPVDVTDPAAVAAELAAITGTDAARFVGALSEIDAETVVLDITLTDQLRTDLQAAIDEGLLPGVQIAGTPLVAAAGSAGVELVTAGGTRAGSIPLDGGATAAVMVTGVDEGNQLYVTTTDAETGDPQVAVVAVSGDQAKDGPTVTSTFLLPGAGTRLVFDAAAELVEVLGAAPDGSGQTIYVVEPHGKAVFADHRLSFSPSAWVLDHDGDYPATSRGAILAFGSGGEAASVDVGSYPFAWRLPGVIVGALTVGVLFLLGRILFRRRTVGVLVGLFVLLDGMFFVQSRIAMNDVFTGFFILAAYLVFAWLWIRQRSWRAFVLLMPLVGVLLGLALSSKWVAAYAIGALGILVLVRSALGRLLLIVAMIGLTCVLGWMGLAVPEGSAASGNLLFALIMIGLTLGTVVVTVYHPISWSDDEVRLAVGGPPAMGILIVFTAIALGIADAEIIAGPFLVTPVAVGFALVAVGLVAYGAFQLAARFGFGPMAPTPAPGDVRNRIPRASPPAEGWPRLGAGLGLPVVWMVVCLLAIPLGVYVVSYLPWAFIEGHQIVTGWPAGHDGQTLVALTGEMYRYHNNLTAAHAASSPWWAWPLNLKPVWFYQGSFAGDTAGAIYDAGNMVIWWMSIPAMAFVAYQAFRRRSLALALILIAFLAQWVSWARIDRAAFQYHYYTSLPFAVAALAYFVAEVWHGASRRTWQLARIAAAVALLGPVILWVLRLPLCVLAGVESVNAGSQACNGNPGNLVVTPSAAALVTGILVIVIVLVRLLLVLGRPAADGRAQEPRNLVPLGLAAAVGAAALVLAWLLPSTDPLLSIPGLIPEVIALVVAIPLGLVALQVVTARDGRRFVAGLLTASAAWLVILYPNISALPLPAAMVNAYQGLLPTYIYAFQFSVNTVDRAGAISFADPKLALLVVFLTIACCVVAYSAWVWRQALADGPADDHQDIGVPGDTGNPAGESGTA